MKKVYGNWVGHRTLDENKPKILFSGKIRLGKVIRNKVQTSLFPTKVSDFLWMAQCNLSDNLPVWAGWNSTLFTDKSPIDRILYLPH